MPGRGRPLTYEEFRAILGTNGELEWHKTFLFKKTKSVGNKLIRGRCYKKMTIHKIINGPTFGNYVLQRMYATHEEMFKHILRHGK